MMAENLHKAEPHIVAAIRRLEMVLWFSKQKKLKPEMHIPMYLDLIVNNLVNIQDALYTDDEYTETVAKGLARVNHTREYDYSVTSNDKGEILYNVDAMLPLKEMKKNVIFARGNNR
jgi:hypothetical protein